MTFTQYSAKIVAVTLSYTITTEDDLYIIQSDSPHSDIAIKGPGTGE